MASVLLFFVLAERNFKWRQLLVLLVPAILFTCLPYLDPGLKVTFLDVGQGDSAVIELPHRKAVYVIDTGGLLRFEQEEFQKRDRPFEIGRQVVVPYLKGKGISSIDVLMLSHADADHAEGADELFELLDIKNLHLSPGSAATDIMQALAPFAQEAAVQFPGSGSMWKKGDVSFSYLSPSDGEYEGNNDSLVLLMESGSFRVLFTGDLEVLGEKEMIDSYETRLTDISLLKVGHHGSKTSSSEEFMALTKPHLSIFSTGKDNRYGHPAEEVVQRFTEMQLKTINTADKGTLEFVYQSGNLTLNTAR